MPEAAIPMPTLAAASAPLLPPQPAPLTNVRSARVDVRVNGLPPPVDRSTEPNSPIGHAIPGARPWPER